MTAQEIETAIEVHATPARVWDVLTDTASYAQWNPTVVALRPMGTLRQGARILIRLRLDIGLPAAPIVARVDSFEPERELSWRGGLPGLARARHYFRIDPDPRPDHVWFVHGERFEGPVVGLVWSRVADRLRERYELLNEALKRRCELTGP